MSKIRLENLVDKDGNTIEVEDKYGYLRSIKSLSNIARNSGKRLKEIFKENR